MELCLAECSGGERVLEIGFGSGVSFLNLAGLYREIHGLDLTADLDQVRAVFARHGLHPDLRSGSVLDMPYADETFDSVLLISILEHLQPAELSGAYAEIQRVLKPGGQMVYGTPVDRPLMTAMFRILGYDIRDVHFSTDRGIRQAAEQHFTPVRIVRMPGIPAFTGPVYEVGHFRKG